MDTSVESYDANWKLFWAERKYILPGLTCGASLSVALRSACPYIRTSLEPGWKWVSNPSHVHRVPAFVVLTLIVSLAIFLCPGPQILGWYRSWRNGVNYGSFALSFATALIALMLWPFSPRYHWLWLLGTVLLSGITSYLLYLSYKQALACKFPQDETDDEIKSIKDAWPERKALAENIAKRILTEGKATYAIYGDFGAGKSSMLNFISDALRSDSVQSPIVIRFNSWLPGSQDNLIDQLLSDISTECSKRYYIPRLRALTSKLARALATGIPHLSGIAEWFPKESQKDLIDDLRNVLARLPQKIVVLIDEIDRIQKEELLTLLKIIRGFSSLPRLSFVCALERKHVENLIQKELGEVSRTFYHKFFNESFQLPKLVDSFLELESHRALITALEAEGWFKSDEQAADAYSGRIFEYWDSVFAPLCTNIREIRRLASTLRSQARGLSNEVDPLDLTLVAALQLISPDVLELFWIYRDTLCATDIDTSIKDPEAEYEKNVISYLDRERSMLHDIDLLASVQQIREVLFSGLEAISNAQKESDYLRATASTKYMSKNREAAKSKRLRSNEYFSTYFQNVLPVAIFPETSFIGFIEKIKGLDELASEHFVLQEINMLNSSGSYNKRINFLEKLVDQAISALSLAHCMWTANVVVSQSGNVGEPITNDESLIITRFITRIADALFIEDFASKRLVFVSNCIRASCFDSTAVRIFHWAIGMRSTTERIRSDVSGVEHIPKEELDNIYMERMESKYSSTGHIDQIDLKLSHWQAFAEWGRMLAAGTVISNNKTQQVFWKRYISSPQRMSEFIQFVLGPFLLWSDSPGPHSYSLDDILQKDDLLELARLYPPSHDATAMSLLKNLESTRSR